MEFDMAGVMYRFRNRVTIVVLFVLAAVFTLAILNRDPSVAQQPLAQPPEGQTYIGTKECAACHFDQFMVWRTTPHAKAFEIMPEKYRTDANCLKCHSTGFGQPTGFKSLQETPNLVGNACENCHGPGSKHAEVAKSFGQKKLSDEESKYVRSTIYRMLPKNVCVECHLATSHKKHPPYDK
jgi:hypothetical protein